SGVTEIGNAAFEGCSGLTSLTLPSDVTEIGNAAFEGCSGLTSL
ncbi:MAG: leucine-rich repeat protein, partial [Segatella copri]